jgi:hypothetical protein
VDRRHPSLKGITAMAESSYTYSVYEDMTDSERTVAEFLKKKYIWWSFEQPVYVADDRNRPRVWSPDFYLQQLGMYVEVVGDNDKKYSYREEVYRRNNIPIIFLYPNKKGWEGLLMDGIRKIHQERWELIRQIDGL